MITRLTYFIFFVLLGGCSPLVGAMLDRPEDASIDIPVDYTINCRNHEACPPGYFCSRPYCVQSGECKAIPRSCDDVYKPVCGCNDADYSNECEMERDSQSIRNEGSCHAEGCTWDGMKPCPDGMVCDGLCGETEGECVSEYLCGEEPWFSNQVCGCPDPSARVFETYDNDCQRISSRAWKAPPENCPDMNWCTPETGCMEENHFCDIHEFLCDPFEFGECVDLSGPCPLELDPVCGCDYTTYLNDCTRMKEGTLKLYHGACQCGNWILDDDECNYPQFCEADPEGCFEGDPIGTFGYCVSPEFCTPAMLLPKEVCGCDDVTYPNECERRYASTSKRCDGPCPCHYEEPN